MLRPKLILYTSQAWPLACSAARGLSAGAAEAGAPASRAAASAATGAPVAATPAPPAGSSSSAAGPAAVAPPNALAQRYAQLLAGGALRPDARQAAVVARLAVLLDELGPYCGRMRAYKDELEEFKARRRRRLKELEAEDEEALRREMTQQQQQQGQQQGHHHDHHHQQQQQQEAGVEPAGLSAAWSWLAPKLGLAPRSDARAPPPPPATPQQRARAAAARRRARVAAELGPGPRPPAAPRGLYMHGSVGSGKSVLMDLFFDAAAGSTGAEAGAGAGAAGLEFARRMHFNAAMLELHGRLHLLDLRHQARAHGVSTAAAAEAAAGAGAGDSPDAGGGGVSGEGRVPAAVLDRALELGEELEAAQQLQGQGQQHPQQQQGQQQRAEGQGPPGAAGGGDADAASDFQVARWFDPEIRKQREAKAAVLAVRRHIREARAGRAPRERLAAANAAVMRAAARSFIRAAGGGPAGGWEHGRGHAAALLCFDELQVTDVWSAVALKALLEALTAEGCVVVLTSNRAPHELPRHGLHEAMWEHFINSLLASCDVVEMSAETDYRRLTLEGAAARELKVPVAAPAAANSAPSAPAAPDGTAAAAAARAPAAAGGGAVPAAAQGRGGAGGGGLGGERLYLWPLGPAADAELERLWRNASGGAAAAAVPVAGSEAAGRGAAAGGEAVPVLFGRQLAVPRAAGGAAWFDFSELCARPLGSADYMALSHRYHTVFISGVPAMSMQVRDQARRFITLVDELYNARTLLVLSADAPPDALFGGAASGEEPIIDFEGLQFETAVEGARLRRDTMAEGGVAPVASNEAAARAAAAALGGAEEKFAFARAVSRLYEMQSALYVGSRPRR